MLCGKQPVCMYSIGMLGLQERLQDLIGHIETNKNAALKKIHHFTHNFVPTFCPFGPGAPREPSGPVNPFGSKVYNVNARAL